MKALLALFGKSPFKPLQAHMKKVTACVERLTPLFAAVLDADAATKQKIVDEICALESEADEIKNNIRGHLPNSLLMPVDRRDLLEILTLQDRVADTCQDIAVTLTLRKASVHAELKAPLVDLLKDVTTTCLQAANVMQQLDELLETSFGGREAEKVLAMLDKLNADETITDGTGIAIARKLFALESELSAIDVMFWYRIFRQLEKLADLAEGTGNRVRLLLAK